MTLSFQLHRELALPKVRQEMDLVSANVSVLGSSEDTDNLQGSLIIVSRVHFNQLGVSTHLVTIAPLVVLGADVLVRVLNTLLQRRQVAPVLPMLIPEPVGIGASEDEAGSNTASILLASFHHNHSLGIVLQDHPIVRNRRRYRKFTQWREGHVLDGDLPPELCTRSAIGPMAPIELFWRRFTYQWCPWRAP